jgi:hypothetical protein
MHTPYEASWCSCGVSSANNCLSWGALRGTGAAVPGIPCWLVAVPVARAGSQINDF